LETSASTLAWPARPTGSWYRANIEQRVFTSPPIGSIAVDTLFIWSDGDSAVCREPAEATADFVDGAYRFEVLEGVDHWLPEKAAGRVSALLLEHLADVGSEDAADAGGYDAADVFEDVRRHAASFTLVEVDPAASAPLQLAVQACAGLKNRELGGSVYLQVDAHDERWLSELDLRPGEVLSAADFLDACVAEIPACARYSYADQQELLPSILAAAAALGAVPLDVDLSAACGEVTFDAVAELEERDTPYLATKHVFETYGELTTGLAMLNPG